MASPHWLYIMHLAGRKGWPDIRVYGIDHTFDTGYGIDNWRQRIVDDVSFACDRQQMVEKLLALPDIAEVGISLTDDFQREIARIRANVREARRYQEAYSGVTQSQISCILPALDRLTDLVEYLVNKKGAAQ